jgi:hypothetical protein
MNKISKLGLAALGWAVASPAFAVGVNTRISITGYGTNDPQTIITNLINWVLGILALIAVILILTGGFKWMTAAGNEEKVEGAKKLIISAIIGMVIVLAAWGISLYAVSILAGVTGTSTA